MKTWKSIDEVQKHFGSRYNTIRVFHNEESGPHHPLPSDFAVLQSGNFILPFIKVNGVWAIHTGTWVNYIKSVFFPSERERKITRVDSEILDDEDRIDELTCLLKHFIEQMNKDICFYAHKEEACRKQLEGVLNGLLTGCWDEILSFDLEISTEQIMLLKSLSTDELKTMSEKINER